MSIADALYHHWDLNGRNGKPAFSKVASFFVLMVLGVGEVIFGTIEAMKEHGLSSGYLIYTLIFAALPYGLNGLKTIVGAKFGGLDVAKVEEEKQKAAVLTAEAAAIKARRDDSEAKEDGTEPV